MAAKMRRITVSIPPQMQLEFQQVIREDGRSQGEVIRSIISAYMREYRMYMLALGRKSSRQ